MATELKRQPRVTNNPLIYRTDSSALGQATMTSTPADHLRCIPLQSLGEHEGLPAEMTSTIRRGPAKGEVREEKPGMPGIISLRLSVNSGGATRSEKHENVKSALQQGLTFNLLFLSFIILIGTSLQFGYHIGVLNQPVNLIKSFYNETYTERNGSCDDHVITLLWSLTTTLFLPGGMIGAYVAGFLADRVGRKKAVLFGNLPILIGSALGSSCVFTQLPETLMIGRFITGIGCGMATQLAPIYLAEITPHNLRGAFGTANQLFITIGILMGSVLGLRELLGTVELWPYLLLVNASPAILCLVILPCLPDSPRYLMLNRKQHDDAVKALRFIRGTRDVSSDMEEMERECDKGDMDSEKQTSEQTSEQTGNKKKNNENKFTMCNLLSSKELRHPLAITLILQVIQQLSGINAIFFYSSGIYLNAGVSQSSIQYAVVVTNAVNVIMTIIAVPVMDKAGRRPLLIYPMIVMIFVMGIIAGAMKLQHTISWANYVSIGCVLAYVICFAVGLGPIPMMIGAELFRQGPRPRALSLAGLVNWLSTALVAISFEPIQEALKEYTFLIFLALMIFFTIFVVLKVPETKNKTFEEIAATFRQGGDILAEQTADDVFDQGSKALKSGAENSTNAGKEGIPTVDQRVTAANERKSTGYVRYVPNPHYIYQPGNFNLPPGRPGPPRSDDKQPLVISFSSPGESFHINEDGYYSIRL
jgi:SP family facilitated glucose transporter-like MFS transporter 1